MHQQPEALNKKALVIVTRVREKLTGHDFDKNVAVSVEKQVELLIKQATSNENLCQCYIGWYVSSIPLYPQKQVMNIMRKFLRYC